MIAYALLVAAAVAARDTTAKHPFVAPKTIAELEARIKKVLDSTKTPGTGLVIVRHDSVIYAGGLGFARVAPAIPATAATLFRIGSTSKSFVALTALALEREGKLSLQDPIAKRLPGFYFRNAWESTDPVRIVNLLEHTSGFDDNSLMSYANNDSTPLTLAQGLALDSATRVSRWRPGTRFSYCNTGPAIVARIFEQIEGKPFEQIIQERWFTPIGMTTATYFRPDAKRVAAATLYRDDGDTPVPYWYVFIRPAGSINASALDMGRYVRFLLGRGAIDGKRLLPAEAIERMERSETSNMARAGLKVGYGLHLYRVADTTGWMWTQHNGGVEGGLSDLSYLPDQGVGYAFQINSGNGDAFEMITQLVRAYLTLGLTPPAPAARTPLDAATAHRFGGWYVPVSPRAQHLYFLERLLDISHVTFADSGARIAPLLGKGAFYFPVGARLFRRAGEPVATVAFVSDSANGRPDGMESFGAGLGGSTRRVSALSAVGSAALAACWLLGLALALVAMLFGGVRWIVRRVRHRDKERAAIARPWRFAAVASLCVVANVAFFAVGLNDIRVIGNATPVSIGAWVAGILFGLLTLAGAYVAFRRPPAITFWDRLSLATVRATMLLNLIAAAYLTYWRYLGWRTWA